jgi:hypothetical protein
VGEGTREVFVGAVTVSVPSQWSLALAPVSPNPTRGDAWATFTLPVEGPAALSLYDVSGRRVLSREVGALGVGRHVVNLTDGLSLAPAVYLVRLEQGGAATARRLCVIK